MGGKLTRKNSQREAMSPLVYLKNDENFSSTQETQQRRRGNDEEAASSSHVDPPSYDQAVRSEEEAPECVMIKKNDDAGDAPSKNPGELEVSGIVQVPYLNGTYEYAGTYNDRPMWKRKQSGLETAGLLILSVFGGARAWVWHERGHWRVGTRGFKLRSQAASPAACIASWKPPSMSVLAPEDIRIRTAPTRM